MLDLGGYEEETLYEQEEMYTRNKTEWSHGSKNEWLYSKEHEVRR